MSFLLIQSIGVCSDRIYFSQLRTELRVQQQSLIENLMAGYSAILIPYTYKFIVEAHARVLPGRTRQVAAILENLIG